MLLSPVQVSCWETAYERRGGGVQPQFANDRSRTANAQRREPTDTGLTGGEVSQKEDASGLSQSPTNPKGSKSFAGPRRFHRLDRAQMIEQQSAHRRKRVDIACHEHETAFGPVIFERRTDETKWTTHQLIHLLRQ